MEPKYDKIDPEQVRKLSAIGATIAEIAAFFDVSRDTIERHFREQIDAGKEIGRVRLRKRQYDLAMSGNATMLIWLGKQMLGQTDKTQTTTLDGGTVSVHIGGDAE